MLSINPSSGRKRSCLAGAANPRGTMKATFCIFVLVSSIFILSDWLGAADIGEIPLSSNPRHLAIDPSRDRILVVGEKPDTLTLIDLESRQALFSVPIGRKPGGVAFDPDGNLSLVSAGSDNRVFVIDTAAGETIGILPVGKGPKGIAIDGNTRVALVANSKSNNVSVIDLLGLNVIHTIAVGKGPKDIAIDPVSAQALVINEKSNDVSVIDLTTFQVIRTIPVDRKPCAIRVHPEARLAVVASEASRSFTLINLLDWQIVRIPLEQPPLDLVINPLNESGLILSEKGRMLAVVDLDTGLLLDSHFLDRPGRAIAVNSLTNVAVVALDGKKDSLLLLPLTNPIPAITSLFPKSFPRKSPACKLLVEGSGFTKSSILYFLRPEPFVLPFLLINTHHLEVEIPSGLFESPGIFYLVVVNPSPGGGTSTPMALEIYNPLPNLTALDPGEAMAGTPGLTLTLHGTGFFTDSEVLINGESRPFTLCGETRLEVELWATDLETGSYFRINVANKPPGGGVSNQLEFTVLNPFPSLSALLPMGTVVGASEFTLILFGENFVKSSRAEFDDQQVPAIFVSSNEIHVPLSPAMLTGAGRHPVRVSNPEPGGGESNSLLFMISRPIGLDITFPQDGQEIEGKRVTVTGTVTSENPDIGIRVNEVIAEMAGRQWTAPNVPLIEGPNQIEVIAKDSYDITEIRALTVYADVSTQTLELAAIPTIGIAPLEVQFSVRFNGYVPILYEMDFDGDGEVDYWGPPFDEISFVYLEEGFFPSRLTVTDESGGLHTDSVVITVLSSSTIDSLLRRKWEGMKESLLKGDIEEVIGYFDEATKQHYRLIFNLLLPNRLELVAEMSDIQPVEYDNRAVVYDLRTHREGLEYSFPLLFTRDSYGIWWIHSF